MLNLLTDDDVRQAFQEIMENAKKYGKENGIDVDLSRGVFITQFADPGTEVIVGVTRDPQFGHALMFGLGGIYVEVMKDVTFYLAPITAGEAMHMLKGTRSYALLEGARGQAPVDLEAIAAALQRISQLVTDYPQIAELDINPFIVGEVGAEAFVADARMTLSKAGNGR